MTTLVLRSTLHQAFRRVRFDPAIDCGVVFLLETCGRRDASVTGEVFLKLLALLAHQGIHTLGQARSAAQRTWYARLQY